jgi:hypothetical protein
MIPQGIICTKCGSMAHLKTNDCGTGVSTYGCRCGHKMVIDASLICKCCEKMGEMPYWRKVGDEITWFCSLECMDYYRKKVDPL